MKRTTPVPEIRTATLVLLRGAVPFCSTTSSALEAGPALSRLCLRFLTTTGSAPARRKHKTLFPSYSSLKDNFG